MLPRLAELGGAAGQGADEQPPAPHRGPGPPPGHRQPRWRIGHFGQSRLRPPPLGDYRQALDCYEQALALRTQLGRRCYETATLDRIGDTRMAMGETDAARQAWPRALHIFTRPRHHHAAPVDAKLGG